MLSVRLVMIDFYKALRAGSRPDSQKRNTQSDAMRLWGPPSALATKSSNRQIKDA